jgi:hypothetical protein
VKVTVCPVTTVTGTADTFVMVPAELAGNAGKEQCCERRGLEHLLAVLLCARQCVLSRESSTAPSWRLITDTADRV